MKKGFAVIFLHRTDSQQPFSHHLKPANILNDSEIKDDKLEMPFADIYKEYQESKERLLLVEYFSLIEYLNLLFYISKLLKPFGRQAILFLAAAVSDFYLPADLMTEHKIQSGKGDLELRLKPVPKLIKTLKTTICPEAFIVSFKLETDESLLIPKSRESLLKNQHNLVVANRLDTRKTKLILLDRDGGEEIIEKQSEFIEEDLIENILQRYIQ